MNSLREALADYLCLRRGLGFKLHSAGVGLLGFISFLEKRGASQITTRLALEWAQQSSSARGQRAQRLSWVRGFATYRSAFDVCTEVPLVGMFPFGKRRARPYLYTEDEIEKLLQAAAGLTGRTTIKGQTYHCLFGLLAVSGMRISEALNLKVSDVDLAEGIITIEGSKLGKSRFVPLHESTKRILVDYKSCRDKFLASCSADYFFISMLGTRLCGSVVRVNFHVLCRKIGLNTADPKNAPRIHDLRHRFAVETLLRWYRNGEDIERKMPVLSTYLGHVHVDNTYWYLTACPELMGLAVQRLEQRWEAGDE